MREKRSFTLIVLLKVTQIRWQKLSRIMLHIRLVSFYLVYIYIEVRKTFYANVRIDSLWLHIITYDRSFRWTTSFFLKNKSPKKYHNYLKYIDASFTLAKIRTECIGHSCRFYWIFLVTSWPSQIMCQNFGYHEILGL